jgi:hypothetical protein
MKKMITLYFLVISLAIFSQGIVYTYDSSGNRISRQYIVQLRSATAQPEKKDSIKIESKIDELKIYVYPNPTKGNVAVDVLGVSSDQIITMRLYSSQGVLLQKMNYTNQKMPINMTTYPIGWYLLKINVGDKSVEYKIIKD